MVLYMTQAVGYKAGSNASEALKVGEYHLQT